jgi:hypothetical protein
MPILHAILDAPSWILWTLGGTLTILSLIVLARALFRDRAKGRRRCPSCWYDMTGVQGLRCPECGRQARKERHLLRTRRRWGRAALASLTLLLGSAALAWPAARARGPITLVPTFILVRLTPKVGTETRFDPATSTFITSPIAKELRRRIDANQLAPSHWLTALKTAGVLHARTRWPKDVPYRIALTLPDETFGVADVLFAPRFANPALPIQYWTSVLSVSSIPADFISFARNTIDLGILPNDLKSLDFDIQVRRHATDDRLASYYTFDIGTWSMPITLVDTPEQVLPPANPSPHTGTFVASATYQPVHSPDKTHWRFTIQYLPKPNEQQTSAGFGFRVEVRHRNVPVASHLATIDLFDPNHLLSPWPSQYGSPKTIDFWIPLHWFKVGDSELDEWTLHVTPDPTPLLTQWQYDSYAPLTYQCTLREALNNAKRR